MATADLAGKIALITGASRGIGAATAEAMAAAGAHVILTARTPRGLEEVEDQIYSAGGSATIAPFDLTNGDSIARLAAALRERWDRIDILMLNAAMLGSLGPVSSIDAKELNQIFTLNVLAQQALIAAFDPMLRNSKQATVIGLSSSVAVAPRAYWGAYGASKAALDNLLAAYAEETRAISAIRVAIVNPGATRTAMRARAYPGEDPAKLKGPEAVAARLVEIAASDFESPQRFDIPG